MLHNLELQRGSPTAERHAESGQAALFAAVLIPVILLVGLFVFNTGQLTATKLKTQNAADAAAFSAMQMEARELNFISYTNRAMVANQVAIGQTISLVSWSHYVKTLGQNIQRLGTLVSWIPAVGQAIATITNAISQTTNALDQGIDTASKAVLPALDIADAALSGSQEAYHMANGVFDPGGGNTNPGGAMTAVAEQMVKLNDHEAKLNAIVLATNLGQYFSNRGDLIKRWGGDKESAQARMAYMINASRDGFTSNRSDLPTPLKLLSDIVPPDLWILKWDLPRMGASQIALDPENGKYVWSGMDTLSLHTWQRQFAIFGEWESVPEVPLGWGAAQTTGDAPYHYFQSAHRYREIHASTEEQFPPHIRTQYIPPYEGSWNANPDASGLAKSEYPDDQDSYGKGMVGNGADADRFSANGITRYQDFDHASPSLKKANGDPADIMPFYMVVVEHPRGTVRDSGTALGIKQNAVQQEMNLALPQTAQGGQVRAIAKAQVYFRRPASLWQRTDRHYERGNLFSPFWEARLVDLTLTDRSRYAALLGLQ
ncbi:MAG TPA: pilus assembly protein TadG-related protein [Acidithiobacillus sp.]|nr:pilus assembly protein TadG-related protein [Acidithiobacillus sp.]